MLEARTTKVVQERKVTLRRVRGQAAVNAAFV